jgi:hypothetical protein
MVYLPLDWVSAWLVAIVPEKLLLELLLDRDMPAPVREKRIGSMIKEWVNS